MGIDVIVACSRIASHLTAKSAYCNVNRICSIHFSPLNVCAIVRLTPCAEGEATPGRTLNAEAGNEASTSRRKCLGLSLSLSLSLPRGLRPAASSSSVMSCASQVKQVDKNVGRQSCVQSISLFPCFKVSYNNIIKKLRLQSCQQTLPEDATAASSPLKSPHTRVSLLVSARCVWSEAGRRSSACLRSDGANRVAESYVYLSLSLSPFPWLYLP